MLILNYKKNVGFSPKRTFKHKYILFYVTGFTKFNIDFTIFYSKNSLGVKRVHERVSGLKLMFNFSIKGTAKSYLNNDAFKNRFRVFDAKIV